MKAMTYNVLTGGQDHAGSDDGRLDLVIDVIAAQAPDVLVLQELNHAEQFGHRVLHKLENATGLRGFLATARTGFHVGVFVPKDSAVIRTEADNDGFHHAAMEVVLATPDGPLTIVGTHLCPFGGEIRLAEAQRLTRYADPRRKLLLMGDLNALDPASDHHEELRRLPARVRARHVLSDGETADTRAVATLLNAGFVDVFRRFPTEGKDYSMPTDGVGRVEIPGRRIDYILATEPLAELTTACSIVSGAKADVASDHYPVVAELDLELA
jgi:exodeoxyribonuclease III